MRWLLNTHAYARARTNNHQVWSLQKDIADVAATKVDQKGVDAEIKKLDDSTKKRVSDITGTVGKTKKDLTVSAP